MGSVTAAVAIPVADGRNFPSRTALSFLPSMSKHPVSLSLFPPCLNGFMSFYTVCRKALLTPTKGFQEKEGWGSPNPHLLKPFTYFYYFFQVHEEVKSSECKYCKMEFRHSNSLKRHMLLHTGERPYSCAHCPLAFSRRSVKCT